MATQKTTKAETTKAEPAAADAKPAPTFESVAVETLHALKRNRRSEAAILNIVADALARSEGLE
jgi:hypothetical protein